MFVTNKRKKTMYVHYKVGTTVKHELVRGDAQVEITDLTAVSQIIFNAYDQRLRDVKSKFPNRNVTELLELRTTANGPLI